MNICEEWIDSLPKPCKNLRMKPVKTPHNPQGDLFKTELLRALNLNHPLVRLGTGSRGAQP